MSSEELFNLTAEMYIHIFLYIVLFRNVGTKTRVRGGGQERRRRGWDKPPGRIHGERSYHFHRDRPYKSANMYKEGGEIPLPTRSEVVAAAPPISPLDPIWGDGLAEMHEEARHEGGPRVLDLSNLQPSDGTNLSPSYEQYPC